MAWVRPAAGRKATIARKWITRIRRMLKRNLTGLSLKTMGKCFGGWREGGFGMAFPASSLFGNERCPHSFSRDNILLHPAFQALLSRSRLERRMKKNVVP